jgi:NAD(P)-dependent dehydrogenase (short-subunit alcohol dehydrogenase family)
MLMCKHAVPLLIEAGGGSIVNISSGTAAQGDFYASAYAASKGAINTLTKYVATQYGARGVRCNALAPGLILTPKLKAAMPPAMQEVFRQHCLTGALGRPAQIGQTILFLVSDHSSFITGQVISADGGLAAHVPTTVEVARLFAPA